jgi:hypothetical protein
MELGPLADPLAGSREPPDRPVPAGVVEHPFRMSRQRPESLEDL